MAILLLQEKAGNDQCQTCKSEIDIRRKHFRTTINELTTTFPSVCEVQYRRVPVQSIHEETLNLIDKVDSQSLCQRLGYCLSEISWEPSATLLRLRSLVQNQRKTLEERLEANNICSEYGQFKTMCEHLMISVHSHRYAHVYLALLTNNPKLIEDDLREQVQTKVNTDVCESCKNAVQSSKDFWKNALVRPVEIYLIFQL